MTDVEGGIKMGLINYDELEAQWDWDYCPLDLWLHELQLHAFANHLLQDDFEYDGYEFECITPAKLNEQGYFVDFAEYRVKL